MGFEKNYIDVRIFRREGLDEAELVAALKYTYKDGRTFIVPAGFKTDFASIPRILWNIIAPIGKHTLAAVLHDYLYTKGWELGISRKEADKIFYDAMIECFVARITANVMWFCVRAFAKRHYERG